MAPTMNKKRPSTKRGPRGPFGDILDVARLLSSNSAPEKVIEAVVSHLCERLGKRCRCALLEGDDLKLRFYGGEHGCAVGGLAVDKDSIVWDVVKKGIAVNLTDPHQTNGYTHSLAVPIKIKCIIPLTYVDPITEEKKKLGALIVDSGREGVPISEEDFEYLQIVGQLISAIAGRAELIQQLMTSCHRQEAILMQTAHNFRNSIAIIGGFSRRIAQLTVDKGLAAQATHLHEEVKTLEAHLVEFEAYMNLQT
jgi:GAF domain-containing protein